VRKSFVTYITTFIHKDEDLHIRAAEVVGREADSCVDDRAVWDFGDDELAAQQAAARLRGDLPKISYEKRDPDVSSGGLPECNGPTVLNPHT